MHLSPICFNSIQLDSIPPNSLSLWDEHRCYNHRDVHVHVHTLYCAYSPISNITASTRSIYCDRPYLTDSTVSRYSIRFTLKPSTNKNELGQPSSWSCEKKALSKKNIDFTSVNTKVSTQKVREAEGKMRCDAMQCNATWKCSLYSFYPLSTMPLIALH